MICKISQVGNERFFIAICGGDVIKRVCCLYRVSTIGQVEKDDIPMQKQSCHEFANAQGWSVVKEYSEKGVSGYKVTAENRDAIQSIKKDAIANKFDILLVFMFDRLGRRDDESPFVVEWFTKQGIEVWSVKEGQQRFDNHVDKLTNYIRFWQAAGESEKTSLRTKTRMGQIVQEGKFKGGYCPYGYKLVKQGRMNRKGYVVNDIVIEEYEASVVRIIFDKYVYEGYGTHRIAMFLTEQGIKSRSGLSWHASTVLNMLKNIVYRGVLRSGETLSEPFESLRIVSDDVFEKAQFYIGQRSLKNKDTRSLPLSTKGKSLLSGNVFCGHCGGRLTPTTSGKSKVTVEGMVTKNKRHYYSCYNKTRKRHECDGQTTYMVHIVDEVVETAIKSLFERFTDSPEEEISKSYFELKLKDNQLSRDHATKKIEAVSKELISLENEVVKSLIGQSTFSADLLGKLINQRNEELAMWTRQAENAKCRLDEEEVLMKDTLKKIKEIRSWATIFEDASLETKKMIISCLICRVTVKRGYDITIEFDAELEELMEV